MEEDPVEAAARWQESRHLEPLWDELARRMSASDRPVRTVEVAGLDDDGRRALAGLLRLKRIPEANKVRVRLAKLEEALHLGENGLRTLVERLRGALQNRAAARAADAENRAALWAEAQARLGARVPATLARLKAAGVPDGNVPEHRRILDLLADTLDRLPSRPPTPLPMLAWEVTGDPHALDTDNKLGAMVGAAALELGGEHERGNDEQVAIRESLRALGVIPDRLSTPTLTLGVRARPTTPLGRLLEAAADAGLPVTIPGALLDAGVPEFEDHQWLCVENPSIVEAALQHGATLPIVCTSGWPSVELQRLLGRTREQGIELIYAGDYDSEGLKIANWMSTRFQATVAMSAEAYLGANLDRAPTWKGWVPATPWQPELAEAIRRRRRVVYQEDPAVWRPLVTARVGDRHASRS